MNIALSILALGVLITFHEFGHYWVALRMGMRVERFSIGFGPPLKTWKRGETEFLLSAVPLGGYVKIAGMAVEDEIEEGDTRSYANKPAWQRLLVIVAGPAANYLLAFIIAAALLGTLHSEQNLKWTRIGEVIAKRPAAAAGLQKGDEIAAVDDTPVHEWMEMRLALATAAKKHPGAAFPVEIRREGAMMTVQLQPQEEAGAYIVGILPADQLVQPLPFGQAIATAAGNMVSETKNYAVFLASVVTSRGVGALSGPVGIVKQMADEAKKGLIDLVRMAGALSLGVGFLNMAPFPGLDGGRFLFLAYEVVTRRRMNQKVEGVIHVVGLVLLLLLIVLVSSRDIIKLVTGS